MIPQWLYRKCAIEPELLTSIQSELAPAIEQLVPGYTEIRGQFARANLDQVKDFSPSLVKFIDSLGLLDRWTDVSIITANNQHPFRWPILNCAGSYTAWYECDEPVKSSADPKSLNGAQVYSLYYAEDKSREIERMDADQCAFINVARPHRPVVEHDLPRVLISTRFSPELFDYFDNNSN
jgi:hypothetical protein